MPLTARIFAYSVITIGLVILSGALSQWRTENMVQFGFYLLFVCLSAPMKVRMPGVGGTMSVNFLFSLLAVTSLNLPQSVLINLTGVLSQLLWKRVNKLTPIHFLFNFTGSSIACCAAYLVFHSEPLRSLNNALPLMVFWASSTYYVLNTSSVATIAALCQDKPIIAFWRDNYFWTAPQDMFGALLTWLVHVLVKYVGWEVSVLVLPTLYLVDRSYRLYLTA